MYKLRDVAPKGGKASGLSVRLLGAGAILREVEAAAEMLAEEHGVSSEVWSVTSFTELRREGLDAERWSMLHPEAEPRVPYVDAGARAAGKGPVIASTDYMKVDRRRRPAVGSGPLQGARHRRLRPLGLPPPAALVLRGRPLPRRGREPEGAGRRPAPAVEAGRRGDRQVRHRPRRAEPGAQLNGESERGTMGCARRPQPASLRLLSLSTEVQTATGPPRPPSTDEATFDVSNDGFGRSIDPIHRRHSARRRAPVAKIDVKVPDIGDFKDVPIIEVLVKPGDEVKVDQSLVTLESDKATMDVPSPVAGKVARDRRQGRRQGVDGRAHRPRRDGGRRAPTPAPPAKAPAAPAAPPAGQAPPAGERAAAPRSAPPAAAPAAAAGPAKPDFSGVFAGPAVRRLARELGLDLNTIKGTGENGRITREDVKAALAGGARAAPRPAGAALPAVPTVDFAKFGPVETVPLSRIKRISGPRLHASWVNVPHVTHTDEADITELEAFRKTLDDEAKKDKSKPYRVSLLPLLMRAAVATLKAFPTFNAALSPDRQLVDLAALLAHRRRRRHARRAGRRGDQGRRPEGRARARPRARRALREGARRQARAGRDAGRDLHHLLARRHRRHGLHADRQRAGGGDPRRGALEDGAGVGRRRRSSRG